MKSKTNKHGRCVLVETLGATSIGIMVGYLVGGKYETLKRRRDLRWTLTLKI